MLVFCEECGKRYSFPPEKFEAGSGRFRCRECGFLMIVNMGQMKPPADDTGGCVSGSIDTDADKRF